MISWFLVVEGKKKMSKFKCDKHFKCYLEHFGVEKCVTASKHLLTGEAFQGVLATGDIAQK